MKTLKIQQAPQQSVKHQPLQRRKTTHLPILSSQNQDWENIQVDQFQSPPGEEYCQFQNAHTLYLSLSPQPVRIMKVSGGKTHSGLFSQGDLVILPEKTPLFCRWDSDDHFLQIQLNSNFMQRVATEALEMDASQLELRPMFRTRDWFCCKLLMGMEMIAYWFKEGYSTNKRDSLDDG